MTIVDKINHSKKLITWGIKKYKNKIAVACSFGKDSIVVVHLARQVKKDIQIFSVMTRYKPKETFKYKARMEKLWKLHIKTYMSQEKIPETLYKTNPDLCCNILKVKPTSKAVEKLDAWITGLRNTEGRTRTHFKEIEEKSGLVKINPILSWTELDIWKYIAIYRIPVHPWYKLGYRSIGCEPCTHLTDDHDVERAGRWQGTSKCGGECGIHTQKLK
jgi:phosphoadenosine phosphosulfate reductase